MEYPIDDSSSIIKLIVAEQFTHLEEYFINERLIIAASKLNETKKKMLYYMYIEHLQDKIF